MNIEECRRPHCITNLKLLMYFDLFHFITMIKLAYFAQCSVPMKKVNCLSLGNVLIYDLFSAPFISVL